MEHVVVRCSDEADLQVWLDDRESGRTNRDLELERGTHTFALCSCGTGEHEADCEVVDYRPVRQTLRVRNTTFIDPLEVTFERV
jgi:hypothetical protein